MLNFEWVMRKRNGPVGAGTADYERAIGNRGSEASATRRGEKHTLLGMDSLF